jgi:hypothetical protein
MALAATPNVLCKVSNEAANLLFVPRSEIGAINLDLSAAWLKRADEKPCERRLARSARTEDCYHLTSGKLEVHPFDDWLGSRRRGWACVDKTAAFLAMRGAPAHYGI